MNRIDKPYNYYSSNNFSLKLHKKYYTNELLKYTTKGLLK